MNLIRGASEMRLHWISSTTFQRIRKDEQQFTFYSSKIRVHVLR